MTFVPGIFGVDGETYGTIQFVTTTPSEPLVPALLRPSTRAILVAGGRIHGDAVGGRSSSVSALVAGGDRRLTWTILGSDKRGGDHRDRPDRDR